MSTIHTTLISLLRGVDDLLRDTFSRRTYRDVIIPMAMLRRFDCVLMSSRNEVSGKPSRKCHLTNSSPYTLSSLLNDRTSLEEHLKDYIQGFNSEVRDLLDAFDLSRTVSVLERESLLFLVVERFTRVDLRLESVSTNTMGTIVEELLRTNHKDELTDMGAYYTPLDVASLMAALLVARGEREPHFPLGRCSIYDPACGLGGLLFGVAESLQRINPEIEIELCGQEINPQAWALSRAELLLHECASGGTSLGTIQHGNTLTEDRYADQRFEYLVANPPFGTSLGRDRDAVTREAKLGQAGRFAAGLPRVNDAQLLFLQHLVAHAKPVHVGGSVITLLTNESPLVNGKAGSGESEIRRWIVEHDLLDTIIGLPEHLFYNTDIWTYIWILTNRKDPRRHGRVQFIDAREFSVMMRRGVGKKHREISPADRARIVELYQAFEEGPESKIFAGPALGYRRITIDHPGDALIGSSEPDLSLRDSERVPLTDDVFSYFDREVRPFAPHAWMNTSVRDRKDGQVGQVGYSFPFRRSFHKYEVPRPLEEIEAEIRDLIKEHERLMRDFLRDWRE